MAAELSFILSEQQTALLEQLSSELAQPGLLWASGYLAGRASQGGAVPAAAAAPAQAAPVEQLKLTVLYGSQTGNAKRIAEQLAEKATAAGVDVRLVRADQYKVRELKKERLLYVVISTHSSGDEAEPPDDSRAFFEGLLGKRAPKVPELEFGVLALGDTSYPDFCGVGRDIDERLEALGGKRLFARGDADVDINTVADPWVEQALKELENRQGEAAPTAGNGAVVTPLHPAKSAYDRNNPFAAEVFVNQRIVAAGNEKDVRHFELSLEDSGITYQPGDALGIWPVQAKELVAAVLSELQLEGDTEVTHKDDTRTLTEWLTHYRELTCLTRPFIQAHAERNGSDELKALLEPEQRDAFTHLLKKVQLIDFLRQYPATWTADELVAALRPLAPRMYSIASAQAEVEEEVHLTVDIVHYQSGDEDRWGVGSHYLADLDEDATVPVFIDPNDRFRLPEVDKTDVIMIGPGTGVAPFRAFLQHRVETGAEGRNWLFFGNRHLRSDFLYQVEWRQALNNGDLTHLDVAFSRDQEDKIYVQDRIREKAEELWQWFEGGAHVYVCGDADNMAPDVHAALIDVAVTAGGKSEEDAAAWLQGLLTEGRYARDVY